MTTKSMPDTSLKCAVMLYTLMGQIISQFLVCCGIVWLNIFHVFLSSSLLLLLLLFIFFFNSRKKNFLGGRWSHKPPSLIFDVFLWKDWAYFSSFWFYERDRAENGLSKHSFCLWALALNYLFMVTNIFTKCRFSSLHCRE